MKLADFFVEISVKGNLKELQTIVAIQKQTIKMQKQLNNELIAKTKLLKEEAKSLKPQVKSLNAETRNLKEQSNYLKEKAKYLKEANSSTLRIAGAFTAVTSGVLAAVIALDAMVMKLARANQLYTNFQRQTGISMGSPIGISGAMANLDVGMTPEEIMQNMQTLQNNLTGIQFGMGNVAPYQIAGIQAWGASADVMMDVIRQRMKQFAPAMRTFLLQQMGLDPRLGALADLSDEEYLKQKQEGLELYLSPEDRAEIQKFAPEWNKAGLKWIKTWDTLVLQLGKYFTPLAKELAHWADITSGLITTFNTIIKPLLDILTIILYPIYLVLEDIMVWLAGGKSLIGSLLSGDFSGLDKLWGAMREGWKQLLIGFEQDMSDLIDRLKKLLPKLPWQDNVDDFKKKHPVVYETLFGFGNNNLANNIVPDAAIPRAFKAASSNNTTQQNTITIYTTTEELGNDLSNKALFPLTNALQSGGVTF